MSANNANKSYDKPMSRISVPYIAGLFDAEGNVFSSTDDKKTRIYVKITQKSDPTVLHRIANFLGYGVVVEESHWKIYSRKHIMAFHAAVMPYLHIKKATLDALVESFPKTNSLFEGTMNLQKANRREMLAKAFV